MSEILVMKERLRKLIASSLPIRKKDDFVIT